MACSPKNSMSVQKKVNVKGRNILGQGDSRCVTKYKMQPLVKYSYKIPGTIWGNLKLYWVLKILEDCSYFC